MTIKEISKKTLAHFKNSGYIFTPSEYQEQFCKESKKLGVIVEDCSQISNLILKLDNKYQNLLKSYKIKTTYELAVFLINNLNRQDPSKDKEFINEIMIYLKRALQVISMLPIHSSKHIASKHIDFIHPSLSKDEIDTLKNEWMEFMTTYNDEIIKKAKLKVNSKSEDIFEILKDVVEKLQKEPDFSALIDSIIFSLTPSYASFMNDEVSILKKQLKENPSLITSKNFENELKILTKKRIKLDKEELRRKFVDIDKITEKLSRKILNLLKSSNNSSAEIKTISKDLRNISIKNDNFESVREKLITITVSLDNEINKFSEEIKKEDIEVKELRKKVQALENQLSEVKKESKTDFLTALLNKRALEEELKKREEYFNRFGHNYSIIFFDIDHFKNVNDTYGHDAGDVVLKSVGLLLKRYSRDIDIIGRFGGEEFVAILPDTDKEGALIFATKINQVIKKAKFMYKNTRIDITISGGVSDRAESGSQDNTIKMADNRVYLAKKGGRDMVVGEDIETK
jgi:diguanylate cyclase (GGDEF)-like protein